MWIEILKHASELQFTVGFSLQERSYPLLLDI